jgi:hypothetical protein
MQKMIRHNDYLKKTEEEATKLAESQGFTVRIIERDGKSMMVQMDYSNNRINFAIVNGKVADVSGG